MYSIDFVQYIVLPEPKLVKTKVVIWRHWTIMDWYMDLIG